MSLECGRKLRARHVAYSALTQCLDSCEIWASLHPGFSEMFMAVEGLGPRSSWKGSGPALFFPLLWMSGRVAETFLFLLLFMKANS